MGYNDLRRFFFYLLARTKPAGRMLADLSGTVILGVMKSVPPAVAGGCCDFSIYDSK
jgi:hypothetical protein